MQQQRRRQTFTDLTNDPRRLPVGQVGKGAAGRRPSMAPPSVVKPIAGNRPSRPSSKGELDANKAQDPRNLSDRECQRSIKEAVIAYASTHGFSEPLDIKVTSVPCLPLDRGTDASLKAVSPLTCMAYESSQG